MKRALVTVASAWMLTSLAAAQCPELLSAERDQPAIAAVGGKVLVAGGRDGIANDLASDRVDVYDSATGIWSQASLSLPRFSLAGTAVDQRAMFAGGGRYLPTFQILLTDVVDVYDATTDTWSTDVLSLARFGLAAVTSGDRAYFAGGIITSTPPFLYTARVDVYDASTGSWSTASLSHPRAHLTAVAVGTKVLFAGGVGPAGTTDVVDVYDTVSDSWSTAALSLDRWGIGAASLGGKAWLAGGQRLTSNGAAEFTDAIDVFDAATGSWSLESLSVARGVLAGAVSGTRLLFAGGLVAVDAPSALVEVFEPAGGARWTVEISVARSGLVGATVADRALFAGGARAVAPPGSGTEPSAAVDLLPAGFARPFCFGDGTGTPCPCGNGAGPGRGCGNSTGTGGLLVGSGCSSMAAETLAFAGSDLPPGQTVLLFVGANSLGGGEGLLLGDGLRCVGGDVVRLGVQTVPPGGETSWGPGLGAQGGWAAGDLARFQLWYRDPGGSCGSGFNLTNGVEVELAP